MSSPLYDQIALCICCLVLAGDILMFLVLAGDILMGNTPISWMTSYDEITVCSVCSLSVFYGWPLVPTAALHPTVLTICPAAGQKVPLFDRGRMAVLD